MKNLFYILFNLIYVISICIQNNYCRAILHSFFFTTKSSKSSVYFTLYHVSQFGLAAFQAFSSHMWLLTAILDSTGIPSTYSHRWLMLLHFEVFQILEAQGNGRTLSFPGSYHDRKLFLMLNSRLLLDKYLISPSLQARLRKNHVNIHFPLPGNRHIYQPYIFHF